MLESECVTGKMLNKKFILSRWVGAVRDGAQRKIGKVEDISAASMQQHNQQPGSFDNF